MFAKCLTASALILSSIISLNAYSQSLAAAQAELKSYQSRLNSTQAELATLQTALQNKQSEITQLSSQPSPEKDRYELAKALAADLQTQANNDPSKAGELKNAQFKLTLAERKFKRSNKQLLKLDAEKKSLTQQFTISNGQIAQLQKNIDEHSSLIIKLQSQAAKREKSRQEQQLKEMARLKAENQRLRAKQLAEQKAAEEALALAAQKAETERAALAAAEAAKAEAEAKEAQAAADRSNRETVTFLVDPEEIVFEEERLLASAAKSENNARKIKKLLIRIKGKTTRSIKLNHIGGEQYRGNSKIVAGDASFHLGKQSWKANIPKQLKGKRATFLLDFTDIAKPYIVYFLKQKS